MKEKTSINRPKDIIQYLVDVRYNLSPLAGVTDLPFRLLCRRFGCAYAFAEMTDAKAVLRANDKTFRLLDYNDDDLPLGAQLVGSSIEDIVEASKVCEEKGFDILNINCACPVPKVKRKGKGVALMNEPEKIGEMIYQVTKAIKLPVVIKIRSGFDDNHLTYKEVSLAAEAGGVSAIFMHPRNAKSKYGSVLRKEHLVELKKAVKVPIFASGNALTPESVVELRESTGCEGVSIARGAMGQPWIFEDVATLEKTGVCPKPRSLEEIGEIVKEHFLMFTDYAGEKVSMTRMYKHLTWYFAHVSNLADFLKEYRNQVRHYTDFSFFIDRIIEGGKAKNVEPQQNKDF